MVAYIGEGTFCVGIAAVLRGPGLIVRGSGGASFIRFRRPLFAVAMILSLTSACTSTPEIDSQALESEPVVEYRIGPGDTLDIFVWRNPELSLSVPVRPDGRISVPLVEDMVAIDKTPTQLARDLEVELLKYIKSATVNVIVTGFVGTFDGQIRVVGMATEPMALTYQKDITLLDVMIAVGGLAEGAAGNRAVVVRRDGQKELEIPVRINDLLNKGKISANLNMMPGDVLIIPASRF
jgi:polysaccharide export outer membrane protein